MKTKLNTLMNTNSDTPMKKESSKPRKEKIESPKVSIAPMVDVTDKHFRYFMRLITKKALLYTEMVTCQGIYHGDSERLLGFNEIEHPLALQIAASTIEQIKQAMPIINRYNYDEINLNAGCPSDRVSGNLMGACLMAYPELVRDMLLTIKEYTDKPVTIKHRIGIDGKNILPDTFEKTLLDSYEDMHNFVSIIREARPDRYTIHARIAILEGLSPKENRDIPPLRYEEVYRLKEQYPELNIEINGGFRSLEDMKKPLELLDGVMIGRLARDNPFELRGVDSLYPGGTFNSISRGEIIEGFIPYVESLESCGENAYPAIRHMDGLFLGKRGSKRWKQLLGTPASQGIKASELLRRALDELPKEVLLEK